MSARAPARCRAGGEQLLALTRFRYTLRVKHTFNGVKVLGVPLDHGAGRRGVDMGPNAIRVAGLHRELSALGYEVDDLGNIEVPLPERGHKPSAGCSEHAPRTSPRFLSLVRRTCEAVYERVDEMTGPNNFPLFLGGDHSIAIGSVGALSALGETGLIWVDAHADFNTHETSLSQNIHGMPLSALCGLGHEDLINLGRPGKKIRPENVCLLGIRAVDPKERDLVLEAGIQVYTMKDIDREGISSVMEQIIDRLGHLSRVHLSFDMDGVDPDFAPGVGTAVSGGLTFREAHLCCELLGDAGIVTSADVVETNPTLDLRNQTAILAVGLIASLMGKNTLGRRRGAAVLG